MSADGVMTCSRCPVRSLSPSEQGPASIDGERRLSPERRSVLVPPCVAPFRWDHMPDQKNWGSPNQGFTRHVVHCPPGEAGTSSSVAFPACAGRLPLSRVRGRRVCRDRSIRSRNDSCALGLPLQRRTGKNVGTPAPGLARAGTALLLIGVNLVTVTVERVAGANV